MNRLMSLSAKAGLLSALLMVVLACHAFAQFQPPTLEQAHLQAGLKAMADLQAEHPKVRHQRTSLILARKDKFGVASLAGTRYPANFKNLAVQQNSKLALIPHKIAAVPTDDNFSLLDKITKSFPIQDQGPCGCCWVFGSVAAFEGNFLFRTANTAVDASEQRPFNCVHTDISDGCNGGWPADALQFLVDRGTGNRTEMPYTARSNPSQFCDPNLGVRFKAVAFGYVNPNSLGEIPSDDELKTAIFTYGAVTVAVNATTEFMSYKSGEFDFDEGGTVNHAVALVGWKTITTAGKKELFWLLRNSWGPDWGNGGYMWIKSGTNKVGFGAAWVTATTSGGAVTPVDPNCPCPSRPTTPNYNDEVLRRISYWSNTPYAFPK